MNVAAWAPFVPHAEKYLHLLQDGRMIVLPASERFWAWRYLDFSVQEIHMGFQEAVISSVQKMSRNCFPAHFSSTVKIILE